MTYRDLVQFDPIDSVVQLRDAADQATAAALVSSYVVSQEMAERLRDVIIPNLRFDQPADTKGLLVVGNYGTGKSHLMSVVSAVAEHADLASQVGPVWADDAQLLAGRFKVVRTEIGATTMGLRDILTRALEEQLAELGVDYTFPSTADVSQNKTSLGEMMSAFQEVYPDQGLLLVVDELLDYLATRDDQQLRLDLGFLREVGEVCRDLRLRFMAGVQEAVFDNPRFEHAAQSLQRVKARFEQVHIASRDVAYVVAERLLKKTDKQLAWIHEHLQPFAKFYPNLAARLDDYVRLFPVHPDYLRTFEQVQTVEKREIFKTLSRSMGQMLDQDVPEDQPGLLSYDSYWTVLRDDPAFRTNPEVRTVVDCSRVLETKVEQAYTRPAYRSVALRVVHALSVHRLTTGDIHARIGLTPANLRDQLCLFEPTVAELGGDPSDDLQTFAATVLREIVRTVNGQFISVADDTSQYYLDVRKDIDHDALIEQRAASLDPNALNRRYYAALTQIMERTDDYYPGTQLAWDDELEWTERHAARLGYLFFGTPNERSTAQPPRDFYLYFVQPFDPPTYQDQQRSDEVFFRLTSPADEFTGLLRCYAAAEDLAAQGGPHQPVYRSKAAALLQGLVGWLRRHMLNSYSVTFQGQTKRMLEWHQGAGRLTAGVEPNVRDIVKAVASSCLANHFAEQAPDYPTFDLMITSKNRPQAAQEAMRCISAPNLTAQGRSVLTALGLLDSQGQLKPVGAPVSRYIVDRLLAKGTNQVVNRAELIEDVHEVDFLAPDSFRLEPEWVAVVLTSLVWSGDVVLALRDGKFDASSLAQLTSTPVAAVAEFKHLERPSEWDVPALRALFELFALPPGLAQQVTQGQAEAVQQLQSARQERVDRIVSAEQGLQQGVVFWCAEVLDQLEVDRLRGRLAAAHEFLESLQTYNTHGRLKNFRYSREQVDEQRQNLSAVPEFEALQALVDGLNPLAHYLAAAEGVLPEDHPWVLKARETRQAARGDFADPAKRQDAGLHAELARTVQVLKDEYIQTYYELHRAARLNLDGEDRKKRLLNDYRHEQLRALASIELLPAGQLTEYQNQLAGVRSCIALTTDGLKSQPVCPHCGFRPLNEQAAPSAGHRVTMLDEKLDILVAEWTGSLLRTLEDPTIEASLELLPEDQRQQVERFVSAGKLPDEIDAGFVQAMQAALSGLEKLPVSSADLRSALVAGGSAVAPDELRRRFEQFLDSVTQGKDPSKVRIVLE